MLCASMMFTLDQRAGGLQKWKVPWKVLPRLLELSESQGAGTFAIVVLREYHTLRDVDATSVTRKLAENGGQ